MDVRRQSRPRLSESVAQRCTASPCEPCRCQSEYVSSDHLRTCTALTATSLRAEPSGGPAKGVGMLIDSNGRNRHVLTTGVPFLREIERRRTSVHRIAAPLRSRDDQCVGIPMQLGAGLLRCCVGSSTPRRKPPCTSGFSCRSTPGAAKSFLTA